MNKHGSKWIRPAKRLAIYLRDNFRCAYCHKDLRNCEPGDRGLDHIKCRSKGGSNSETNLVTSCRSCNSARGNKRFSDWVTNPNQRTEIRKVAKRSLKRYLVTAKELLAGGK